MSKSDDIRNLICDNYGKPRDIDHDIEEKVKSRLDDIAKPLDGLGEFEKILIRIGGMTGSENIDISKRALVIMCADNGIVEEGISQTGSDVTRDVAGLMAEGKSSVGVMTQNIGCDIYPVNIGIKGPKIEGLADCKVMDGTNNFLVEKAMNVEEAFQAIRVGIEIVKKLKDSGYRIAATGEMGIGNTTTSAALISAALFKMPEEIVGRGAGLSDEGLLHKINVVKKGLTFHNLDVGYADIIDILCSVGGLDIAGMAGVFIGGAIYGMPVLIDGMISAAAALTAALIMPEAKEYMIAAHIGKECGMKYVMEELGMSPVLDAGLKLGEGTGAVMLFPLLDMAVNLYNYGKHFSDIELQNYERF
ncbi:nicotinate-nucleotide-dimethylbenzimidazole phosphoribosyltransferase [Eubacterium ruminantium]|nr:nicotinate-nucleotide-dimethylbenzimidazole phosphoribosyltransferase [Eubacterium ruminantium]